MPDTVAYLFHDQQSATTLHLFHHDLMTCKTTALQRSSLSKVLAMYDAVGQKIGYLDTFEL